MSELISGREALIALANGDEVEIKLNNTDGWHKVNKKDAYSFEIFLDERGTKFRLKPRTITINGIEVPAPFEPKEGDIFYILSTSYECGYVEILCYRNDKQGNMLAQFGAWRTEDEIKQVVSALRSVFKGGVE